MFVLYSMRASRMAGRKCIMHHTVMQAGDRGSVFHNARRVRELESLDFTISSRSALIMVLIFGAAM